MNVLMVTSSYPRFPGDVVAPFIESIARGVAARGHAVEVVLPHHPELRRPDGDTVSFLPYRYAPDRFSRWGYAQGMRADVSLRGGMYLLAPLAAFALRASVAARLRDRRYDVVHAHWVVPNAAMIADVVRAHRVPLVVSLHGSDVFVAERLAPARALARHALGEAGFVSACSEDLRRRAIALGARPERTRTVPYGADVPAAGAGGDVGATRARLGAPPGAMLVLALGRLVEKKGFAHLVDAAARVPGLHLAIAGEGDLRDALQQRIARAGAPARLAGVLDRDGVAAALAAADVVAVPSVVDAAGNVDGLPNVLLEAMAAGRAVVASRVAGIPDVVTDGVDGLLAPPADPAALAAALARLAGDPALRERLGRAARATVEARLGWERAARAFEEGYAAAAALDAR
jgi:glycosyltransferase involved in cell wall biosynthesis